MALARCHFAYRADLIVNGLFDAGPTPLAQQDVHMPCNAKRSLSSMALYNNSFEKLDFPNLICLIAYNNLFQQPQ